MKLHEIAYREEASSSFTHNGVEYSVNRLLREIDPTTLEFVNVSDVEWVLQYSTPDPSRVQKADLHAPIVVIDFNGRLTCLDGLHRIAKAVELKKQRLLGYTVTDSMLRIARI